MVDIQQNSYIYRKIICQKYIYITKIDKNRQKQVRNRKNDIYIIVNMNDNMIKLKKYSQNS